MSTARAAVCFVLLSLLLLGCRGEFHQFDQVEVSLSVHGSTLEVVEITGVEEMPNPPVDGEAVTFEFHSDDGSQVVEGAVRDTRMLRSEFDEEGQPDPRTLIGEVGLFDIRVPARAGRLVLTAPGGEPLGEVEIDPDGLQTRTMALLDSEDVLAGPVKIVNHGDSSRKVDILFLPEGYTEEQMGRFHADVDSIVAQISTHAGYREHWSGFNIWRQDVRSRTEGTGRAGRPLDTAFDTASGISGLERCVFFANPAGAHAARQMGSAAGADATVVLVNSFAHGGCASEDVVVSSRPRNVADIVGHELAHGLFGLADEYSTPRPGGHCSVGPNVASSVSSLPWADLLTTNQLPTSASAPLGTVGAFEGGGYCERGRYRPTHNCMMRTLGSGMCPVCRREVARTMATLAPEDSSSPDRTVSVTNASGAPLWVRCDGETSSTCTDWTFVRESEAATIRAPGRRIMIHNRDIVAPVLFDFVRLVAGSGSVTIHANAANPFTPSAGGSSTGGSTTVALTAPQDLVPNNDATTDSQQVALFWSPVDGATRYLVAVEVEENRVWTAHDQFEIDRTSATILVRTADRRYRWRVTACDARNCVSSRDALFWYRAPDSGQPTNTNNNTPTAPPGIPAIFSPAHEATVPAGPVTMTWSDDVTASSWNLSIRMVDPASQQWLEPSTQTGLTSPNRTLSFDTRGTWYAWTVQACNSRGCSAWTEYSLIGTTP